MLRKGCLLFFVMCSFVLTAQDIKKPIYGMVKDTLGKVIQATIFNKKTYEGATTNDFGVFTIYARQGDSIQISSVGYSTKTIKASARFFNTKLNEIVLKEKTYILDEVIIKNALIGTLSIDLKKTPEDKKRNALKNTMDFSEVNMKVALDDDHIDKKVRPPVNNTDPNGQFVGASVKVIIPFKYSERLWALRRNLAFKESLPEELKMVLGDDFFYQELKIPEDQYYNFLEYCNPLGIETLYKNGKVLDVIKILIKESKSFLLLQHH